MHTKPRHPLIFQSSHGATVVVPNSTGVRQQLYNTQQPLVKLLPLWRLQCFVRVQDPQPAASRRVSSPDPTAAAAAVRRIGKQSEQERGAISAFPFGRLRCLLLCTSPRPPTSVCCDSHGATAIFQGITFVAVTNSVRVRMRACAILNTT